MDLYNRRLTCKPCLPDSFYHNNRTTQAPWDFLRMCPSFLLSRYNTICHILFNTIEQFWKSTNWIDCAIILLYGALDLFGEVFGDEFNPTKNVHLSSNGSWIERNRRWIDLIYSLQCKCRWYIASFQKFW